MTQRWMKISATALYGASSSTICGQRQRIAPKTAPNSHQCTQILTVQTKLRCCKSYAGPGASLVAGGESGLVVGVCGVVVDVVVVVHAGVAGVAVKAGTRTLLQARPRLYLQS